MRYLSNSASLRPRALALTLTLTAAACGEPEGALEQTTGDEAVATARFVVEPRLTIGPSVAAPLVGVIEFETERATRLRVEIDDGARRWVVDFAGAATEHKHPLLGLRPDRQHRFTLTLADEDGTPLAWPEGAEGPALVGATAPLPDDFPALTIQLAQPERMEPGYTLFNVPVPRKLGGGGYIVGLDATGELVWFHRSVWRIEDSQRLPSGNTLVLLSGFYKAYELDVYGEVVGSWHAANIAGAEDTGTPIATDTFHHEIFATADDTFMALSSELRAVTGFPRPSDFMPTQFPSDLVGTIVVEFARDGTILEEWSLLDMLDPLRATHGTYAGNFFDSVYPASSFPIDWDHSNAVFVDPADDGIVVSLRHQDAVVKFDRAGALQWILAPPANWSAALEPYLLTPEEPDFQYPFQQHAPMITPQGTLLLFDNALYQASPPSPPVEETVSRAVEFELDLDAMRVRQVWQYGEGGELGNAPWVGDADWLPETGNILVAAAGIKVEQEGEPSMRILELTHAQPAERVFEVSVDDDNPSGLANRMGNEAERVPDLYPAWAGASVTWIER